MDHEQWDATRWDPGPESRTGLIRPGMTEAEFERQAGTQPATARALGASGDRDDPTDGAAE